MKKNLTRSLAFLFILSALVSAGCQEKADDDDASATNGQTETLNEAETELSDDLPEEDFEGASIRVAVTNNDPDMITDNTGDLLNDAVYERNSAVEERFHIKYEILTVSDTAPLHNSVVSDSEDWQILFYPVCNTIALANQGDFLSTNNLPYVDLDKPWWDSNLKEGLSISGNLFYLAGDISPVSLSISSAMMFNKDLFDDLNLDYPYQKVMDGAWTLDALAELTKNQTTDLDGDSKISSSADSSDRFGMIAWMWDAPYSMFYGAGGNFVEKDENDLPVLNIDVEKCAAIYEKIYSVIIDNNAYFAVNTAEEYNNAFTAFIADRALIIDAKLTDMAKMRDMESDYGVLPLPKYDEQQDNYITFVNDASNMISVPKTLRDPEMISIILEAMASESYRNLTPDFKEYVLKGKYPRDNESSDMVELIIRNRVFDIAYIYDLPTYGDFVRPLLMSKSKNVASTLESARRGAERSLESIVSLFAGEN